MKVVSLGGLEVSAQGLGCAGMSSIYGPADWDTSVDTIRRAVDLGITLIDTANVYGSGQNEVLVGRAVAGRRDQVQVATKAGMDNSGGRLALRGDRGYLKQACVAALERTGLDHLDLFYLHRVSPETPIEESVGALAELVQEGKVRHLGLCEVTSDQLRAAAAVHPIAAVQSEYSLWTRDPESTVVDAARELSVGLVAYSPLGKGFLTGTVDPGQLDARDGRRFIPRFVGDAADANRKVADAVATVAGAKGVTSAQVALAWVSQQSERIGVQVVPIPGTKRVRWVEENAAAADVVLTAEETALLDVVVDDVVGSRHPQF